MVGINKKIRLHFIKNNKPYAMTYDKGKCEMHFIPIIDQCISIRNYIQRIEYNTELCCFKYSKKYHNPSFVYSLINLFMLSNLWEIND